MDAFFSHTQELLSQGYTQVLIGLYVAAQAWWWLKRAISTRNKVATEDFTGKYSVIVVAYRPDPARLSRTLKSIVTYGAATELIVAIDDAPHAPKKLKTIATKYATKVIEAAHRQGPRELYAKAAEALKKRSDIIITVAPGAVWDESTARIATPFSDERVGAVSGQEVAVRPAGFVQNLGAWLNRTYFTVIMPFQSALGAVRPLSPYIMAVRRDIFITSVLANRNETFLGRRVLTAHNESITARILAAGQRTMYAKDAVVTVPVPETLAGLRKTYVQRFRGSVRSLVRHTKALQKTHPLVTLSTACSLFSPVVYLSAAAACVFIVVYGVQHFTTSITPQELALFGVLVFAAYLLLSYLRHLGSFRSKQDVLWLPMYVVIGGVILLWAKTIALFTFTENTPDSKAGTEYGEGKVGRARTAAAAFALSLCAVALPVAYVLLVHTQNVPLSVITSQQGRPYALAREYAERLRDNQPQNDPNSADLVSFVRANAAHYGQDVNEHIAESALLCVRSVLIESSLHGALDNTQACYAHALTIAQDTDPHTHVAHRPGEPEHDHDHEKQSDNTVIKVGAKADDTFTWLIRAEAKKSDTKKELSAAQAVFIETTYLSQTKQLDRYLQPGEQVEIDLNILETVTQDAKKLPPAQIAAWDYYAQNIVW